MELIFHRCIILGIIIQEIFKTLGYELASRNIQMQVIDQVLVGIVFGNAAVQVIQEGNTVNVGGITFPDDVGGENVAVIVNIHVGAYIVTILIYGIGIGRDITMMRICG